MDCRIKFGNDNLVPMPNAPVPGLVVVAAKS
jgi:hypothetical protein